MFVGEKKQEHPNFQYCQQKILLHAKTYFEVNCSPRSEVFVLGIQKMDIQEKINAHAHAAAKLSDKRTASIHLDVLSMTVRT
jgi:hypothetical protein